MNLLMKRKKDIWVIKSEFFDNNGIVVDFSDFVLQRTSNTNLDGVFEALEDQDWLIDDANANANVTEWKKFEILNSQSFKQYQNSNDIRG